MPPSLPWRTTDTAPDPIFFYANRQVQWLFEMTWAEMVALPSRHSAEPLAREDRQRLLDRVSRQGYIDDYAGVRIARTGKRFLIANATVWNLLDPAGQVVGHAAAFDPHYLMGHDGEKDSSGPPPPSWPLGRGAFRRPHHRSCQRC